MAGHLADEPEHLDDEVMTKKSLGSSSKSIGEGGGKITKAVLVQELSEETSLSRKQSKEVVGVVLQGVIAALRSGKSVGLTGVGTFIPRETAARKGVLPVSGERITIPAGRRVTFRVASTLRDELR